MVQTCLQDLVDDRKQTMKGWLKVSGRSVPHLFRVLRAIALLIAVSGPAVAADSESSVQ